MLELLIFFFGVIALGVGFEKIFNEKLSLVECARKFRTDFLKIFTALFFSKERYAFDDSLKQDFLEILDEYSHRSFEPHFTCEFQNGSPCLRIAFIQSKEISKEEIQTLCALLNLKFEEYIRLRNLHFRHFITYHKNGRKMFTITIFYEEFKEDTENFLKNYKIKIAEKSGFTGGVMHDKELDAEIKNHVRKL